MWLIDRHTTGQSARRIALPDIVRSSLVRWYVGEGTWKDEETGIVLVQQARIGEKWIACDCLPADKSPPILTPAYLSEAETYYLRRLTGANRPEHRIDCPFFRDQAAERETEARNGQTVLKPPAGYFEVLRPAPDNLSQKPESDASDDRARNPSVPRLARLLWRLMNTADVHMTPPFAHDAGERSIAGEFKALIGAASQIEIAPAVELGRALWTHPQAYHTNRVFASLRTLSKRWPRDHAPQAFLALYASAFKGPTIYAAGGEPITIATRVQSPSVRGNIIQGPYLVLVVIGQYPEARGYSALRAYAQPVYSGQRFVPVDSDFERQVFRGLLETRRILHRAGIDLAIEKPLFDRLTDLGPCRPDFVLEAQSRATGEIRQLVVEAMGFTNDEYLAAKQISHPRMARIAPIVEITAADVDAGILPDRIISSFAL